MKLIVNGEEKSFRQHVSINTLIEELHLDTRKIAIECNLEIISKSQYDSTTLSDGDRLEIIHFIGGG